MKRLKIAPGQYLIASPSLLDENFRRTVILICEHGADGSLGLVVNRATPLTLERLDPRFALGERAAGAPGTIYLGGPVEKNRLMVLKSPQVGFPGQVVREVAAGLGLVANIDDTLSHLHSGPQELEGYRFFLGYAGWGKGQLQKELREGSWIIRDPDTRLAFHRDPGRLWQELLRDRGGRYSLYAEMPHDPDLN
ncbi:MAG: YqgE/AlgH family protein [Planctomycetes bacterium]|nr:YqgE/AlgH family protein [Planctomycetota bacterium]